MPARANARLLCFCLVGFLFLIRSDTGVMRLAGTDNRTPWLGGKPPRQDTLSSSMSYRTYAFQHAKSKEVGRWHDGQFCGLALLVLWGRGSGRSPLTRTPIALRAIEQRRQGVVVTIVRTDGCPIHVLDNCRYLSSRNGPTKPRYPHSAFASA